MSTLSCLFIWWLFLFVCFFGGGFVVSLFLALNAYKQGISLVCAKKKNTNV